MGFVLFFFLIHSAILCLLIGELILFTFKAIIDRYVMGLPWWLSSNKSACSAGATWDTGSKPRSGRSPGGRHGNPLQYSCLENPRDRGAWQGHKKLDRTEATQHAHTCDHWHFVHCFLAVLAIFSVTFFSFFLPLWFDDFRGMLRFVSLSLVYLLQVFALWLSWGL